ncbi:MAG: glycoside hydrolase family 127 protein, partial [Lachnospiraceae bacterium]|nr:glycoside hydrolase family 127 protein [Lachnospiraceae bacterium]
MIAVFDLDKINIIDKNWKESIEKNALFIDEMDTERVLSGFRRTCKLMTEAKPYEGWENSLIAGHALGHYFSALAMRIASTHDERYVKKAKTIIAGLKECQDKIGSGFLSAASVQDEDNPYIQFDILEGKEEGKQWVPWYALHKVLQGLTDFWIKGKLDEAGEVTLSLADWVTGRALSWDEETRKKVLSVEYGGMNDTLYQLYIHTGKKDYLKAAKVFDEPDLYERLLGFGNRMKGVHANATIPKILGYLTGAIAIDKKDDAENEKSIEIAKRIDIAKRFWEAVINNQTYATGGIGDMEHFFEDRLLDGSRTQCNAESCCCYNMMKLSQLLFRMTGEVRYLEYIEKTLWNAKLGSIGPQGGYTYFNPMGTGYYRLYSSDKPENNPFWCCVGTGMEDFASAADKIYYIDKKTLLITQWISSDLAAGQDLYELRADYDKGRVSLKKKTENKNNCDISDDIKILSIKLRIPRWIKNRDSILSEREEYLEISLDENKEFIIDFEMEINLLSLPDEPSVKGFSYGPFVLCVLLGNEKWGITQNAGIDVYAPAWKVVFDESYKGSITYAKTTRKVLDSEYLTLPKGESVKSFSKNYGDYFIKEKDCLILKGLSNKKS